MGNSSAKKSGSSRSKVSASAELATRAIRGPLAAASSAMAAVLAAPVMGPIAVRVPALVGQGVSDSRSLNMVSACTIRRHCRARRSAEPWK